MCMVHTSTAVEMGTWDYPGGQQSSMWLLAHGPHKPPVGWGKKKSKKTCE